MAALLLFSGCQSAGAQQHAAPDQPASAPVRSGSAPAQTAAVQTASPDPWPTPRQIADAVEDTQKYLADLTAYGPLTPDGDSLLRMVYGIEPDQVTDWCVRKADGKDADEISVFRAPDSQTAAQIRNLLDEYGARREAALTGYVPDAAQMVSERIVASSGPTAVLAIVHSRTAATQLLQSVLEGGDLPMAEDAEAQSVLSDLSIAADSAEDAGAEYDHDAVMLAWSQGSPDGLSPYNAQIYMTAFNVIQDVTRDGMTPWEKESAIHDWMVSNIGYDVSSLGTWWWKGQPQENADTPYGALVNRVAVCGGYASTFQLLMDMLGIPCMTIYGASGFEENEHIWNLVQLENAWYHVDVTWDDPVDQRPGTAYLNETDSYMREHGPHIWNAGAYPASAASRYMPASR